MIDTTRVQIHVKSKRQMTTLFATLNALGYKFGSHHDYKNNPNEVVRIFYTSYPAVVVYTDAKTISGNYEPRKNYVLAESFEDFLAKITAPQIPPIEVKLNREYTAIVSTEDVKVGCQTFSFDIVKKLNEAVEKQIAAAKK